MSAFYLNSYIGLENSKIKFQIFQDSLGILD